MQIMYPSPFSVTATEFDCPLPSCIMVQLWPVLIRAPRRAFVRRVGICCLIPGFDHIGLLFECVALRSSQHLWSYWDVAAFQWDFYPTL